MPWIDTTSQVLEKNELENILQAIFQCQSNVLVHCAQGKSRSGTICVAFLALLKPTVAIEDLTKEVKSKRAMAEPNPGFMQQLNQFQKDGFFKDLAEKFASL